MDPGLSPLANLIRNHIRKSGPISFAQFMDQALYHPLHGYYSAERTRIGRAGDFYTSVSVGPLFGEILAAQFIELFVLLGAPDGFKLLEQGAEDGQLASDILKALSSAPEAPDWEYWIVEPSAKKTAFQKALIGQTSTRVRWASELEDLESFTGVIFCNELLDALPCHLVEHDGEKWNEICVDEKSGIFDFVHRPMMDTRLARQTECLPKPALTPYRAEINLAALDWIKSAARVLRHGYILAIDYGFPSRELYSPLRTEGTLTGYYRHQRQKDLLQRPGEIDITAHVDFSAAAETARSAGCTVLGFTDQHHFMVGAGERRLLEIERLASQGSTPIDQSFLREYRSLMHPNTMGLAFKYLLLGKGVTAKEVPTGFKYVGDPAAVLR
jgi:SAM-dependent MidA family methyltransferase